MDIVKLLDAIGTDKNSGTLERGCVYTVASRPGMGKTTIGRHIANKLTDSGQSTLYVENEMIYWHTVRDRLGDSCDFVYRRFISLGEIERSVLKNDYAAVVIDFFGYISHRKNEDVAEKIVRMAKRLNVAVIVLTQLSRRAEFRTDKRPKRSDMTKSLCGTLWHTSVAVVFLYREAYYDSMSADDTIELTVAKNKGGGTATVKKDFAALCRVLYK